MSNYNYENTENLQPYNIKNSFRNELTNHFKRLQYGKYIYNNLPQGIEPYYIEKGLFEQGIIGLTKNTKSVDDKYYALYLTGYQEINFNGEITIADLTGYKTGGAILFPRVEDNKTAIFMKNNINNDTTHQLLNTFINKLVDIWYSDNINLLLSNKKLIAMGKPEHYEQIITEQLSKLDVSPILVIDKDRTGYDKWLDTDINRELMDYNVNYEPLKYSNHFKDVYAQALNRMGIIHNSSHKAERNISDELTMDSIETQLINEEALWFREDAINRFNELYGLNVTVEERSKKLEEENNRANAEMNEDNGGEGNGE